MDKNSNFKPCNGASNNRRYHHELNESLELSSKKSVKMDNALEKYYIKMGRNDYRNRTHNHAKGKFLKFFDDNEYDSDDMDDELGDDVEAKDCSYIEFDDNFPVHPSIKTADEKQQEIFRILKNCYKYGKASKMQMQFQLTENFMRRYRLYGNIYDLKLNLEQNDVNLGLDRYKKQCRYSFANKALTDNGMAYSFAVGVKNNNFPFLQTILDIYMRDSLQSAVYYNRYISKDPIYDIHTLNDYTIKNWATKSNLKERIANNGANLLKYEHYLKGNIYDGILSGIDKYLRICPRLHINPLMLIKDDIYQIAKYFLMAYGVMKQIMNNQSEINAKEISFQFDIGIACNKSVQKKGSCFPALWDDISDDELLYANDSDFDYEENDVDGGIRWTTDELEDCIGDIHNRLTSNNCIYVRKKLSASRVPENVQMLQRIDEEEMNVLINVCRKYLRYDENKMNNILNFSLFEYRKQDHGNRTDSYDNLCDQMERLKILSLQNIMDTVCPEMAINRIIFEILDYEMGHDSVYELLCNLIEKNVYDSFGENHETVLNMYEEFSNKLNIDSEFSYPNQCRFCAFIDRRNEKDFKYRQSDTAHQQYADTMYFFQPQECQFMPLHTDPNILPEWHFNAIQTSFLPKFNPNGDIRNDEKECTDRYHENQQKPITSHSLCNGALLMLSFIVESKDVIKCYLFRDSTFVRFFPQDIIDILPKLFLKEYGNNAQFATKECNVAECISNKMQYVDRNFQYWCSNGEC